METCERVTGKKEQAVLEERWYRESQERGLDRGALGQEQEEMQSGREQRAGSEGSCEL